MSTETTAPTAPIAAHDNLPAEASGAGWGAIEDLDTNDLLVPKIYHQQAMSKFVSDGNARPGDFCDSLTGEVLCKKDEKLNVIIFGVYKTMMRSKWDNSSNRFEFESLETITPQNAVSLARKPLVEEVNGERWQNNLQYNYYCLLPDKIDELPYVLTLGSTKTKTARQIATLLTKLGKAKKPGASVVFEISSISEENDKGKWFGLDVHIGRAATEKELGIAYDWYVKSKSQKIVAAPDTEDTETVIDVSGVGMDDNIPF